MPDVTFYRDDALPFLEAKRYLKSDFAYQKHFHEEYSIGLIDEGETNAWCDGTMHYWGGRDGIDVNVTKHGSADGSERN